MSVRLVTVNGQLARNQGIALVIQNARSSWKRAWHDLVYSLPEGWEGTGEDIRFAVKAAGVSDPHSTKCWGAMVSAALGQKMLEYKIPWVWVPPTDVSSHARPTRVLRRTELI